MIPVLAQGGQIFYLKFFMHGMFCSKRFSCLFESPCLFKGKSNLSVPDVFLFSSANFFF